MNRLMRFAAVIAVLSGAWLCAGCATTALKTETKTEWVGHPMVSDNAPYTPSEGWLSNVEIGLRSDGVVVWKIIERK
jgi:hypothetical protein